MEKAFSLRKGYTFSFEEEGNLIEAWFSAFSGLEKVYVNGELVSCQRNLSANSTNSFKIGASEYSTNLKVVNFFKGPFVCTLSKDGEKYKRQKLSFPEAEKSLKAIPLILRLLFFVVLGAAFGFARAYWQLPQESFYVFLVLLLAIAYADYSKNQKGKGPVIEHEEIV